MRPGSVGGTGDRAAAVVVAARARIAEPANPAGIRWARGEPGKQLLEDGREGVPLGGAEALDHLAKRSLPGIEDLAAGFVARRRHHHRHRASVRATPAFDEPRSLEPVHEPDGRRVGEAERPPELIDRLAVQVGRERSDCGRPGAGVARGRLGRGAQAIGYREREAAEEVARSGLICMTHACIVPAMPVITARPGRCRRTRIGIWVGTGLTVALSLALVGCGGGSESQPPEGPLAEALAEVGGGGANGSLGIGWAEPGLVEGSGARAELIADALGPNAGSVIEAAPLLRRRFGMDPLSAERLVSVGGSYAFGLRLDGIDGRQLGRALGRAGARLRQTPPVELTDVGEYAVVPEPLLRAGVRGLGARDAFGPSLIVLAISARARASLLGQGDRLLEQPIYRAAADCLGDVLAARMIPERLLLSTEFGVDLVAIGVRADGQEVLCVLGGSAERAGEIGAALESSLAPDAREPRTGEPMADIVAAVDVVVEPYEGVEMVRAELTLAAGQSPGFLFGTVSRGSVVELIIGNSEQ
jgi:hypothetical protein